MVSSLAAPGIDRVVEHVDTVDARGMVTSFLKQLSCTPGYRIAQKFVSVIEDELSMKIDVRTSFSLLFAIQFLIGCQRTIRDGPIVIGYKNADVHSRPYWPGNQAAYPCLGFYDYNKQGLNGPYSGSDDARRTSHHQVSS